MKRDNSAHLATLDGLRGVAAGAVVLLHISALWGDRVFSGAYLAVDFFFVLSGLVIGLAYDEKLRSGALSCGDFIKRRVVRLWPLYLIGLAGSFSYQFMRAALVTPEHMTAGQVAVSTLFGVLMVPTPPALSGGDALFPVNFPAWSLFFEVVANVAYALVARWITTSRLLIILGVSGVALVPCVLGLNSGVDLGPDWSTFAGGVARVIFGFSLGLAIFRLGPRTSISTNVGAVALGIGLWLVLTGARGHSQYDLVAVSAFPLLVILGSVFRASGWVEQVCRALGKASYGMYVLHIPIAYWGLFVLRKVWVDAPTPAVYAGLLALVGVVGWLAEQYVQPRATAWLRRPRLAPEGAPAAPVAARD